MRARKNFSDLALLSLQSAPIPRKGKRPSLNLGDDTNFFAQFECAPLSSIIRRGVLVDLQRHHILDLLPDRQKETAATWMQTHPEITHVSRDRSSEYASAVAAGAPQAIQVADRFHVAKNLSEAVQQLLARVLLESKTARPGAEAAAQAK